MKKLILVLCCFFYLQLSWSQEGKVLFGKAIAFKIPVEKDTVEFVVVDSVLSVRKPLFLWCQGSLPYPIFGEIEGYGYEFFCGGIVNFDYKAIREKYHIVVISMPKTPLVAPKENLNNGFQYITDKTKPHSFAPDYLQNDYLDNYVKRGNAVLKFLKKKKWVNNERLVVAGHSQGTKVATKIATTNKNVTHLGLFGANPFGRVDQFIREARLDAQMGKTTWEKADSLMQEQYDYYELANHPDSLKTDPTLKTWQSFSEPIIDDWLSLNIPIYIAYGTEDRVSDLCDLVPLFFMRENKKNLTLKRYLHLEHNFFEKDTDGKTNYDKPHWSQVMNTFLGWVK